MKKIFKILFILSITITYVSCDDDAENVIYNGVETENRTFLSFTKSIYDLPVNVDSETEIQVTLNSSTVSTVDRTYSLILNDEETTANPMTFVVPASVTIPAGSYQGTFTIQGMDNDLLEIGDVNKIVLELTSLPNMVDVDNTKIIFNLFQICPFNLDSFVGTYTANEDGYCDGCYSVDIELGEEPNTLVLSNLYDVGGTTTVILSEDPNFVEFTEDYLYTSTANGDVFANNPSAFTGNPDDDISTFNTCSNYMDLYFRPCIASGACFPLAHIQLTKN